MLRANVCRVRMNVDRGLLRKILKMSLLGRRLCLCEAEREVPEGFNCLLGWPVILQVFFDGLRNLNALLTLTFFAQPVGLPAMTLETRTSVLKSQAFSLVELLVVISVIGIIATIALPTIANATDRGNASKAARNAQSLCSLIASARSAGATNQWTTVDSAIDDLQTGIIVKVGAHDVSFNMSSLSAEEREEMMPYLTVQTNTATVCYVGPASQ